MKFYWRCPYVSFTVLAIYVMVNVFAGALHHHHKNERSENLPPACKAALQWQSTSSDSDEGEENCLLCRVLHLAQKPAARVQIEGVADLIDEAFSALSLIHPSPIEPATRARSPPVA